VLLLNFKWLFCRMMKLLLSRMIYQLRSRVVVEFQMVVLSDDEIAVVPSEVDSIDFDFIGFNLCGISPE